MQVASDVCRKRTLERNEHFITYFSKQKGEEVTMKKLLMCILAIALAMPVLPALAQEEENACGFCGGLTYARYRFNHYIDDPGIGDTREYFDDDFDTVFTFQRGDVYAFFEWEISDANAGGDKAPQASYADAIGAYGGRWTPESMADSAFKLEFGDIGTGFGKLINNDDSPWGSIEVSWKMGTASVLLGFGKDYEGNIDDDLEGDINLIRGQFHMPLGESGFNIGAYAAAYVGSDVDLQTDPVLVQGDTSVFLGSLEFSGTVGGASIYSEVGFATGSMDEAVADAAVEYDLAGFYVMGGLSMAVGQITLGVEAGFGSGDDDPADDSIDDFLGFNNDFGYDMLIEDDILGDGLSNKMYIKGKASLSPTEKMTVGAQVTYSAPTEDVAGVNGMIDFYGVEFMGSVNYKLSDYLTYVLEAAVASLEEDWLGEDNAFQMMNRLELLF
jgi:hypothetical protein